jgi:hypothetical protein
MNAHTSLTIADQHHYASFASMRISRSAAILGVDVMASLLALGWIWSGLWFGLLGFSVYHSRGDVWLPTPPAAREFFSSMVLTGTVLFAALFVMISVAIFIVRRFSGGSEGRSGNFLTAAFYGDNRRLYVKYAVFLSSVFISPYFYSFMRTFRFRRLLVFFNSRNTQMFRIYGGFAITFAILVVAMLIADMLIARSTRRAGSQTV